MKYPKNKDWLIWLFEFRWWWWKSQILFQVETVNQPWSLLTVWKRSWHPTKKYSVGIMLLMRTWASRNRKYRQPTWYFLWSRKYRVGSVGGGSTLVTNDQPSYFQPTREMAHSIAWEMAQLKGRRGWNYSSKDDLSWKLESWLLIQHRLLCSMSYWNNCCPAGLPCNAIRGSIVRVLCNTDL